MAGRDLLWNSGRMVPSEAIAGRLLKARKLDAVMTALRRLENAVAHAAGTAHTAFHAHVGALVAAAEVAYDTDRRTLNRALRRFAPPSDAALWEAVAGHYARMVESGALFLLLENAAGAGESKAIAGALAFAATRRGNVLARLARSLQELGGAYLDQVPPLCRPRVATMAIEAHPTKGGTLSLPAFQEKMAQWWLAAHLLFQDLVTTAGFAWICADHTVPIGADLAVLALTASGSIIGLTRPSPGGIQRTYVYDRISIRESMSIAPTGSAVLRKPVQLGGLVCLDGAIKKSSPVIALASHQTAGLDHLHIVSESIVLNSRMLEALVLAEDQDPGKE